MSAHSLLGPSSASRRLACKASYSQEKSWLELNGPQESSSYANEGTDAHEIFETSLIKGATAAYLQARSLFKDLSTEDLQVHVDYIESSADIVQQYVEQGYTLWTETRLNLQGIHEESFGTADVILYHKVTKHLVVIDFKYGAGIAVDVNGDMDISKTEILAGNSQLTMYTYGAKVWLENQGFEVTFCTAGVLQPRITEEPLLLDLTMLDLEMDIAQIRAGFAEATSPEGNTKFLIGDHCRWCSAKTTCKAQQNVVDESISASKDFFATDVASLSDEQLLKLRGFWDNRKLVDEFFKGLSSMFYAMVERGEGERVNLTRAPGRMTKSYDKGIKTPEDLVKAFAFYKKDLDPSVVTDTKLMPQTRALKEVKKALGKEGVELFSKMLVEKEGNPRLVDIKSENAIEKLSVDDMFKTV